MMLQILGYVPFRDPLWGGWDYWYLMLLPLALLISLVYKSMRVEDLKEIPRQTVRAFLKFVFAFLILAAVLWAMLYVVERYFA